MSSIKTINRIPGAKYLVDHLKDPLFRNSYYIILTNITATGSGFFFWLIVANFYSVEDVGLAVALISASGLIAMIAKLGLDISLIRFLADQKDKKGFINTCLTFVFILSIILSLVYVAGIEIWSNKLEFIKDDFVYIIAFVIVSSFLAGSQILSNTFIALRDAKYSFFQSAIMTFLRIPLPIILASFFTVFGVYGSWGIAVCSAFLVSSIFFVRRVQKDYLLKPQIQKSVLKKTFKFSLGNFTVNIASAIPGFILPLMVLQLLNPEMNAYFYVAFMIANVLNVIPLALSMSLLAEGSNNQKTFVKNTKKAAKFMYLIILPAVIIIMFTAPYFLLIYGKDYSTYGAQLLSLLAISGVFLGIDVLYSTYLKLKMKLKELVLLSFLKSLGIIFVSYIMIIEFGILGIGFAVILVQFVIAIYCSYKLVTIFRTRGKKTTGSP